MAQQIDTNGTPTSSAWVNTLVYGGKWTDSVADGVVTVNFTFMSGGGGLDPFDSGGGKVWADYEQAAVVAAFECWENVCNIDFVEVGNANNADLTYWLGSDAQLGNDGTLGWHEMPGAGQSGSLDAAFSYEGTGWSVNGLSQGGYGFVTLIHEIGHGIGLAHPHADYAGEEAFPGVSSAFGDFGRYNLNQGIYTTMSYNDGYNAVQSGSNNYGWQGTAMALDIAAAQVLYGVNTTFRTGNDVYALPGSNGSGTYWSCIWDAGGTDTITAAGISVAVTIYLDDAELTGANAGGYISAARGIVGGYTIAAGAVIENAIGGDGNDVIVGNEADNHLTGGLGNDTLTGGAGTDTLFLSGNMADYSVQYDAATGAASVQGADGADRLSGIEYLQFDDQLMQISSAPSGQVVPGGTGADRLVGSSGDDEIYGYEARDRLWGLAGNDTLDGGGDADVMRGGTGDDIYYVDTSADQVIEAAGQGSDTILTALSVYALKPNVENLILTSDAGVTALGNGLANQITAGAGDDLIFGGAGADHLTGGDGADSFVFDTLRDSRPYGAGDVIDDFVQGDDLIDLELVRPGTFVWNGTMAANSRLAEVWYETGSDADGDYTMIHVDTDRDAAAEMSIRLSGLFALTADDFLL